MGLSLTDYYKMTYGQYQAACEGYLFRLNRQEDIDRRIAWVILKGWANPAQLPANYKVFWPLPIDDIATKKVARRRGKKLTEEEFAAFIEREK